MCSSRHDSLCLTYGTEPDQLNSVCRTNMKMVDECRGPGRPKTRNVEPEAGTGNVEVPW